MAKTRDFTLTIPRKNARMVATLMKEGADKFDEALKKHDHASDETRAAWREYHDFCLTLQRECLKNAN